jgi:hypothetical protein
MNSITVYMVWLTEINPTDFHQISQTRIYLNTSLTFSKQISDSLKQYNDFVPPTRNVPKLDSFETIDDDKIIKIMTKLGNNQCILEPFPVNILNKHKHCIVSEITKLVKCLLISWDFPDNLKEAVVKPMIKNKS